MYQGIYKTTWELVVTLCFNFCALFFSHARRSKLQRITLFIWCLFPSIFYSSKSKNFDAQRVIIVCGVCVCVYMCLFFHRTWGLSVLLSCHSEENQIWLLELNTPNLLTVALAASPSLFSKGDGVCDSLATLCSLQVKNNFFFFFSSAFIKHTHTHHTHHTHTHTHAQTDSRKQFQFSAVCLETLMF